LAFKRPSAGGGSGATTSWTALTNAAAVKLENITVRRPQRNVKVYDEIGKPQDSYGVDDFVEGSATAQLSKDPSTTTTVALQPGDAFSTTFDFSIGAENFVVTSADAPQAQLEYFKQNISFQKLYVATP
jgi:hypothetical protein